MARSMVRMAFQRMSYLWTINSMSRIDDSIKDKPEFEICILHPMCYVGFTTELWINEWVPIFIWCNKCNDDRECIMLKDQNKWKTNHICQPKCKHGRNIYRPCWKCKWLGWW